MLFAPMLAGIVISGFVTWHLLLVGGMLAAYLASTPLILWIKQPRAKANMMFWAAGYGGIALLFGLPLLLKFPELIGIVIAALMVLLINIRFAVRRQERHMLNDLAAICGLALGAVAADFIGQESYSHVAWFAWTLFVIQFFGSVLYVKSLIREKNNPVVKRTSAIYQAGLIILPFIGGFVIDGSFNHAWIAVAFAFSAVRDWTRPLYEAKVRPLGIGLIEIANTIWFVAVITWLLR